MRKCEENINMCFFIFSISLEERQNYRKKNFLLNYFLPFFKKGRAADFCDPGTLFNQSVNIHLEIIK